METFNQYAKGDALGKLLRVEQHERDGIWFVDLWQDQRLVSRQLFDNERDACTAYALGILLVGKFAA